MAGTLPLIVIPSGKTVTFKNGCVTSGNAQSSTTPYLPNSEIGNNGKRPAMQNKGTLTLNGTSLRAGDSAPYVLKNESRCTVTLDGGGSLEGGAKLGSSTSLLENSGIANVNHYVLDASWIISNANMRPANAIKNTGTCYVNGGTWCAIGCANTGINNSGTCTIYGRGTTTIHGSQIGINNTSTLTFSGGNVNDNAEGINNSSNITYSGGNVQWNTMYGVHNTGTIKQSGGCVSYNGYKPSDTLLHCYFRCTFQYFSGFIYLR